MEASGNDIQNNSDQGHFVYRSWSGDGEIVAQVTSIEHTHDWGKSGVMFRESLDANAKNAYVVVTPSRGVSFQHRANTAGNSLHQGISGINAPVWLKLKKICQQLRNSK